MPQKVQTLIFNKETSPADVNGGDGWTRAAAVAWAGDHNFRNDKVDDTSESFRLRQFDPDKCMGTPQTLTENFPAGVAGVSCEVEEEESLHRPVEYRRSSGELRVIGDDKAPVLEGHAAVFNQLSDDLGGFREQIVPGAFAEAIKGDVRALWNHDNDLVLGRTKSGTLTLAEDEIGLAFRVMPPDTDWFRARRKSIERGDVTGASFGFWTESDEWQTENGQKVRTILKIRELLEISPGVTFPAYPQADIVLRSTGVALRSLDRWEAEQKKLSGLSAEDALVSDLKKKKRRLRLHGQTL